MYEDFYAAEMTSRGIKIFKLDKTEANYKLTEIVFDKEVEAFARRNSLALLESWLRLFFDEKYRKTMLKLLMDLKSRAAPPPKNFQGLSLRMIS